MTATYEDKLAAYLYAGGGEGPFPSRSQVLLRCADHGTGLGGIYETPLGVLVAATDSFDGAEVAASEHPRGMKLPAGFELLVELLEEHKATELLGLWCPQGGRLEVRYADLRSAWTNRRRHHTLRVHHP